MGHPSVPPTHTYTQTFSPMEKQRSSDLQSCIPNDNLNFSLGAIRVLGLELIGNEVKPHLNTVLESIQEGKKGAAEQVVGSGVLPILALCLRRRGPLTVLTAKLVAELAKEPVVGKGFGEAGLVAALTSVLTSMDQELLYHAIRAISRLSHDSSQQELLLKKGVVPRLVSVLLRFPNNGPLEAACLLALCSLADMGEAEEAGSVWERGVSVKPGETVFRSTAPRTGGFGSAVTVVRVSQWAPGQNAVSVEEFQRCSSAFWNLHRNQRAARTFPLSGLGGCADLYNVIKYSVRSVPRTASLRTRMFHTFL